MIKRIYILLSVFLLTLSSNAFAVAPENGWWWNPTESGSGYAIERQGNSIFMAAFLYETSGAATWYATLLTLQPDGTYKGDMTRYVGGKSLLGTYKPATPTSVVATATASFTKPDIGTMTIAFTNGATNRNIPISRFAFASPSFEPSKGSFQSGWWWNDQESGTGYFIEVQGTSAFIASFMYDTTGQPTWYASLSSLTGTNVLSGALDMYANGQALGGAYKAPTANAGGAGSMSYGFTSDSIGNMTLPNAAKVAIKRFAFDASSVSNHPPVPNAGPNQTVTVGDTVNLSGTGTDADGDALTFSWRLLSVPTGSATTLNVWSTSKANFVADVAGTYRLELIADDGKVSNGGSVVSITSTVKTAFNLTPIAKAGVDKNVAVGTTVNLNGAASYDPNGDAITFRWSFISKPSGSNATFDTPTSATPSFKADSLGLYVIGLNVNDGKSTSTTSQVIVNSVTENNLAQISNSHLNPVSYGKINLLIASGLDQDNPQQDNLNFDILAVGDSNMDGYDDLLIGIARTEINTNKSIQRYVKPVLLIFNPITNDFEVSEEFKNIASRHVWPRQGAIADFDGDGRNDIFIGDTGIDGTGNDCGYFNSLVLNKADGMKNSSHLLPYVWDYSHGLIVDDFNRDGIKDLFILNSPYIIKQQNDFSKCVDAQGVTPRNRSYVLAGGSFEELGINLLSNDLDGRGYPFLNLTDSYSPEQHVGRSYDLNNDGFPDLILGGSARITIIPSTGKGTYGKAIYFPIPSSYPADPNTCSLYNKQCDRPYSYIEILDIDNDGYPEIIASFVNNYQGWRGQYFQVLKNINQQWKDITDSIFPNQNSDQNLRVGWCYRLQFADLNNDGNLDIICNSLAYSFGKEEVFWIADNGKFIPWSKKVDLQNLTSTTNRHTVINTPSGKHVIGFSGFNTISIIGWKL